MKSSSAPSVVSAPCLDDHAFFFSCERQWKASRFSTCEMWRKCDILCFFFVLCWFVFGIRFLYPTLLLTTSWPSFASLGEARLQPLLRPVAVPAVPAVPQSTLSAVNAPRRSTVRSVRSSTELSAELRASYFGGFLKSFLFQNLGREWYLN